MSGNAERRQRAQSLHERLIEHGRVPLLSWHHVEELMGGEDDEAALRRIHLLQELPMIAFLRLPKDDLGLGSIVQILAAEAMAASEGLRDLASVRDRAKELLLRIGPGVQAVGEDARIWKYIRPIMHSRKMHLEMVSAFGPMKIFDENQTIGALSKSEINSPRQIRARIDEIYVRVVKEALQATRQDVARSHAMADAFMKGVIDLMPPAGTSVRELIVSMLVKQGLDEAEIRDEAVLADLSRLAAFRNQLRIIAPQTGRSFSALKTVPMETLPSQIIAKALRVHGQARLERPGSDVHDGHLAALAAYCSVLYVDKRTAEDFVRVQRKEPQLARLIGKIAKGADFEALLRS
ncbi:hypothetical protein [Pseudoroseomonas cervicalis]|uniref:hypothetical protein n=1 Tax=Teichococcus cervicalis TaxID=204525 RepID=UPI0027805796|nr:hypothetical protein [Pseudoroseomonas cervicalis]MDQ1077637.1 hypothetical protein [Pseudoroseomonas cervicalis]